MKGRPKRFMFSVDEKTHQALRKAAFDRNISMALYVIQALVWRLEQEKNKGE